MVMGFGEPTLEMQAELNRLLGVPVVRPRVDIIPREVILAAQAGMETEDEPPPYPYPYGEGEQVVIPPWRALSAQ